MCRRGFVIALLTLLSALPAAAQFYSQGSEPAGVRWMQIRTPDYKVIYPAGLDSLARVYADWLERSKAPVGTTAGYLPNQNYSNPLHVVLHPWTANANGVVAQTPRRMELYTTPDASAPLAAPWEQHLIIHENRHVAQMQFTNEGPYKPFHWFLGELFDGAATAIYGGQAFFEGDAVVAETELTASGRGRDASFLEYYRAAYREGKGRDWWQWRYGSLDRFTPDHYTLGYITMAGMRTVYGAQDFTAAFYRRIFRKKGWPWPLFNMHGTVKEFTGLKFNDAFAGITDSLSRHWALDEAARAPFMPSEPVTKEPRRFTEYSKICYLGGSLYAVRGGSDRVNQLVRIGAGGEPKVLSQFAYSTSSLKASEPLGRLYWSEIVADPRWEFKSYSEIWYCGPDGAHKRLSHRTRWYNPSVSEDGLRLAVVEYPPMGGARVLVLDAASGEVLASFTAPGGLQPVETAWAGERIIAACIDDGGSVFADATDGFRPIQRLGSAQVKDLFTHGGAVHFTSDAGGVDELYRLGATEPERLSNSPLGGQYFRFTEGGDSLVFASLSTSGRQLRKAAVQQPKKGIQASQGAYYLAQGLAVPKPVDRDSVITIPAPERYSRLAGAFRVHSWAPVYIDYDAIDDMSFESIASSAGLGAMAFMQNDLGTLEGTVAYNAGYSKADGWSHYGEAKITYSGLLPKIEASAWISSNPASVYFLQYRNYRFGWLDSIVLENAEGVPAAGGSLKVYVPLKFNSGGWFRGIVPQVQGSVSNSMLMHGKADPMNRVSASLRAYIIQSTPTTCIYPKFGIGVETGWSGRIGAADLFSPNAYLYAYGYLPGLMSTHGIRLAATVQKRLATDARFAERYVSVMPRGMSGEAVLAQNLAYSGLQGRASVDYAFPFLSVDWSGISPVAYVRNFECYLRGDVSAFSGDTAPTILGSAGASLAVVLGNLLWIPFDTRIGVTVYRNFGPVGLEFDPWNVSMMFSVDL